MLSYRLAVSPSRRRSVEASIFRYIDNGRTSASARRPMRRRVRGNIGHLDSSGLPSRPDKQGCRRPRSPSRAQPLARPARAASARPRTAHVPAAARIASRRYRATRVSPRARASPRRTARPRAPVPARARRAGARPPARRGCAPAACARTSAPAPRTRCSSAAPRRRRAARPLQ
ncbi:hypothetical protein EGT65_07395 [Burkholderia mallei]|uniref:Uncharacterized protein n=1 Tax=Burkholderia mallei TaxID=13373 RepID=A0AAX1XCD5_BURML|nr:hypothetical protein D8O04_08705 [Burkholderia mallei]RPA11107.1 hypothetical protein EGT58_004165 [Burkholderia mallei]RPA28983.1 hypothetical protein EGT70_04925 [Burkholderia mallei]RPA47842.1 hypothetical protein EGT65_07395 [Burkholderia mallei]RPA48552.1 hypothetical protein EGT66_20520 [Burkholderia mallei]